MIFEAFIASILGGYICSVLGYYVSRIGLSTLAFTIAHAALAGAATALLLGLDTTYSATVFSIATALILGSIYDRVSYAIDTICMTLFSFYNAIALLAIYYSNTYVLATASLSAVLWGSVLAVTIDKLIILASVICLFTTYTIACKKHIDSILFDIRLAEAEGINTKIHILVLLIIASISISVMLRIVGGFLVFTLLYVPSALASTLQLSTKQQYIVVPLFGSTATMTGVYISLLLDIPVGVSIVLANVLAAILVIILRYITETVQSRCVKF